MTSADQRPVDTRNMACCGHKEHCRFAKFWAVLASNHRDKKKNQVTQLASNASFADVTPFFHLQSCRGCALDLL